MRADVRVCAFRVWQIIRQATLEDAQLFKSEKVAGILGGFQRHLAHCKIPSNGLFWETVARPQTIFTSTDCISRGYDNDAQKTADANRCTTVQGVAFWH